jgi:hypothetical protein
VHPRLSKIKVTKLPGARKHNTVSFTLNRACSRSCIAKEGSLLVSMRDLKAHQNTFRKFDLLEQQAPI